MIGSLRVSPRVVSQSQQLGHCGAAQAATSRLATSHHRLFRISSSPLLYIFCTQSVCRCADQCGGSVWRSVRRCADQCDVWTVGTIALHRHDDDRESTGQRAQSVCRSARMCVPISTGVCADQRVNALISVAVVCGDQCDAVLISVMCG